MSGTGLGLAIVGMAARFPQAADLESLWNLLLQKRCVYGPLPDHRLDRELYYHPPPAKPGKTYCDIGGVIEDGDLAIEPLGLEPEDVEKADIAHLWFLETALRCVANAGLEPSALKRRRLGVFVGHVVGSQWAFDRTYSSEIPALTSLIPVSESLPTPLRAELVAQLRAIDRARNARACSQIGAHLEAHSVAALVAKRLQTTGPWMAVDAACASSFAALQTATHWLDSGKIDLALVGGCSYASWSSLIRFSQAQALSPVGTFPFDEREDGFVSSDGYAAILVEPLKRAVERKRNIRAVILSLGASCDGRGKSLWAPLKEGQVRAIKRAYSDRLRPDSIQVVEAHATGTRVGDAVELEALSEAFREGRICEIPLTAIKGNLGHTRETAGLAGLVKMVLSMEKGTICPTANFAAASACSSIDWKHSPFRVVESPLTWPGPGPRRCAVNSFGIGGINFHLVLGDRSHADTASNTWTTSRRGRPVQGEGRTSHGPPQPVAVIGLGSVLPGLPDSTTFAQKIDRQAQFDLPDSDSRWDARIYTGEDLGKAQVLRPRANFLRGWKFDWKGFKIPPRIVEKSDPLQLILLDAAHQALSPEKRTLSATRRNRVGVFAGSIFLSDFTVDIAIHIRLAEFLRDVRNVLRHLGLERRAVRPVLENIRESLIRRYPGTDESGSYSASTLASRVAKQFDLRGPCLAIDAGEASGAAVLFEAVEALRQGECDLALCCAGQRSLHHSRLRRYQAQGWLESDTDFPLGEGGSVLLLQRLQDVRPAEQPVLAVIDDIRCSSSPEDPWDALEGVIREAGSGQIELLQLFGKTGETTREWRLLSERLRPGAVLRSVNSRLGLTQGASALVGLLDSILAAPGMPGKRAFVSSGLNSIAFRGTAYHIRTRINTNPNPARESSGQLISRVFQLEANTRGELLGQVERAVAQIRFAWTGARPLPQAYRSAWRLAIVASDHRDLRVKLKLAESLSANPRHWPVLHEKGIFFHQAPSTPAPIAWVFPGQGSAYTGMLRSHIASFPEARQALHDLNSVLVRQGEEEFEKRFWMPDTQERLAKSALDSQAGCLAGSLLVASTLRGLGMQPDRLLGHSFGEYAALVSAGCWEVGTALRAAATRAAILDRRVGDVGKLMITSAPPRLIEEIQGSFSSGHMSVANRNSPEQTVLAVENALLDRVLEAFESRGEVASVLPVPLPYHSALLEPARAEYLEALKNLPLLPPRIPFLSGVEDRYIADPGEVRRSLAQQLVTPLDFVALIRRSWDEGMRVFIEVGPRSVATRLIRSILKGHPVLAVATDHPRVHAREQLLRVRTLLETLAPAPAPLSVVAKVTRVIPFASTRHYPEPVDSDVLHLDATLRRGNSRAAAGEGARIEDPSAGDPFCQLDPLEREVAFLVCEQTGYPPEMITLDLDIEADLGIDSIRKAQLLGELLDQRESPVSGDNLKEVDIGSIVTLQDVVNLVRSWGTPKTRQTAHESITPVQSNSPGIEVSRAPSPEEESHTPRVFQRWILRSETLPPAKAAIPARLPTLLVGGAPVSAALRSLFGTAGSPVSMLEGAGPTPPETLARHRRLVLLGFNHTVRLLSQNGLLTGALESSLLPLFRLLQDWISALQEGGGLERAELLAVTHMGGDFRPTLDPDSVPFGGAISGLLKALAREYPQLKTKIVDLPAGGDPQDLAEFLFREAGEEAFEIEVGFSFHERVRPLPKLKAVNQPEIRWSATDSNGAWIISGGGRGITAFCARELAKKHRVTLHLLGRTSPEPVPDEWMQLSRSNPAELRQRLLAQGGADSGVDWDSVKRRIELQENLRANLALGLDTHYHCVDIRDRERLAEVIESIRARGKPIRGLLHGAGIEEARSFLRKHPERILATLFTKVVGLQNLLQAIPESELSAVIGFGSQSGRFGGEGQADYSCASDLLAKLLTSHRLESAVRCTTFHWPAWAGLGMAVRPESRFALKRAGRAFLEPEMGARFLLQEIGAGLPESEVLIMNGTLEKRAPGPRSSSASQQATGPLRLRPVSEEGKGLDCEILLHPEQHPLLNDHRLNGRPVVPAALSMELAARAALRTTPSEQPFQLSDIKIKRPLIIGRSGQLRTLVRVRPDAAVAHVQVLGRPIPNGTRREKSLSCEVRTLEERKDVQPVELPAGIELYPVKYPSSAEACPRGQIFHGPSLQSLKTFRVLGREGWGEIRTAGQSALPSHSSNWRVFPAILDAGFLAAGIWLFMQIGGFWIPVAAKSVSIWPQVATHLWVHVEKLEQTPREARFDILTGDAGGTVIRAREVSFRRLGGSE